MKKFVIVFIIFASFLTKHAEAQFGGPVTEVGGNWWTNIATTVESVWQSTAVDILEPSMKKIAEQAFDKVVEDTLVWATGGFSSEEPGFINNWDDFLKGTEHDVLSNAFSLANNTYGGSTGATGGSGSAAQQNYNTYTSAGFSTGRGILNTIAEYGSKRLNYDPLNDIINQRQENLTEFLGSAEAKEEYKNNFAAGGWGAYIAQTDANNSDIGITSMTKAALSSKSANEVEKAIDNQQTPVKFLDKTDCTTQDEAGNCTRYETTTPAGQIDSKVSNALLKDEDLAANAEGLIAQLIGSAVGKITRKLSRDGIAGLTNTFNSSSLFSATGNSFSDVDTDYQSSFDVLGVQSDGFGNNSTSVNLPGSTGSSTGRTPIGGPEDVPESGFGGPQTVVNLKERLEQSLNDVLEEKSYFDRLPIIRAESRETLITLDQCLPGPDYGWETRFRDELTALESAINENDKEEDDEDYLNLNSQVNSAGLRSTQAMFSDPRVNIPGARTIKRTIDVIIGNGRSVQARNKQRIDTLSSTETELRSIKAGVLSDFNGHKQSYAAAQNLVLFYDDWDNLSTPLQESAFSTAVAAGYYLIKQNESIQSVVANNNEAAASAVIDMAWDIWRDDTPRERKDELRSRFNILEGSLSNSEFILRAKSQVNGVEEQALTAKRLMHDCLVLKAYALGIGTSTLQQIVLGGNPNTPESDRIEDVKETLLSYGPMRIIFNPLAEIDYIHSTPNARVDSQIKTYIEQQRNNQINNLPSVFLTTFITEDVSNSILGFANDAEKNDYFNTVYPTGELPYSITHNKKTLYEMYLADRIWINYPDTQGLRGILYCRHTGDILQNRRLGFLGIGSDDEKTTACLAEWYVAKILDYQNALDGVSG